MDRPLTLTRRLVHCPLSVFERASRPLFWRVQVRRFRPQVVFTKGKFSTRRFDHRRFLCCGRAGGVDGALWLVQAG
eukprot:4529455-Pyramimonas_sp.AAC.1